MSSDPNSLSFWEHVESLRSTLIWVVAVIGIGTAFSFLFHEPLLSFLSTPYQKVAVAQEPERLVLERVTNRTQVTTLIHLPDKATPLGSLDKQGGVELLPGASIDYLLPGGTSLIVLSPVEGFVTALKVSLWAGMILTSPVWVFVIILFVRPGLQGAEPSTLTAFYLLTLLFFGLGLAFAFYVTLPIATAFFFQFNGNLAQNTWALGPYLSYVVSLSLANGVAFELFVLLVGSIHLGVIGAKELVAKRRHVIVGLFVVGAILTPPDVLTQCLVALPLVVLYEIAILYARLRVRKEKPLPLADTVSPK